ncbi:hypothetical protein ACFSMW_10160 [Virgibacillus halophilus]
MLHHPICMVHSRILAFVRMLPKKITLGLHQIGRKIFTAIAVSKYAIALENAKRLYMRVLYFSSTRL